MFIALYRKDICKILQLHQLFEIPMAIPTINVHYVHLDQFSKVWHETGYLCSESLHLNDENNHYDVLPCNYSTKNAAL